MNVRRIWELSTMTYEIVQDIPGRVHLRLEAGRLAAADERALEGAIRSVPGVTSLVAYRAIGELAVGYSNAGRRCRERVLEQVAAFEPAAPVVPVRRTETCGAAGLLRAAEEPAARLAVGVLADAVLPLPARLALGVASHVAGASKS